MNATANTGASTKVITLDVIRGKDRKQFGKVHPGEVAEGHKAEIVIGKSITLHGAIPAGRRYVQDPVTGKHGPSTRPQLYCNHFQVGDVACVGSYNLVYTGTITAITAKTITVVEYFGTSNAKTYKLDIATFDRRNWNFDVDAAAKQNAEWRD